MPKEIYKIMKQISAEEIAEAFTIERTHNEAGGKIITWTQLLENHHLDNDYEGEHGKILTDDGRIVENSSVNPQDEIVIITDEYIISIEKFAEMFPNTNVIWFD